MENAALYVQYVLRLRSVLLWKITLDKQKQKKKKKHYLVKTNYSTISLKLNFNTCVYMYVIEKKKTQYICYPFARPLFRYIRGEKQELTRDIFFYDCPGNKGLEE